MNKIAPQDMRQHMVLNQSRLSTAEEDAQEIEDKEFSRDDKKQSWTHCFSLQRPMRKVENLMECRTTLDRVLARRAKEKCKKDLDFNPSVVNSESFVDTVIGVGESGT